MEENKNITPMMQQFLQIKKENPGFVILFRLGDFYEFFDEDAIAMAPLLGLTLTKRQTNAMCGFPYHAKENYIQKLVQLKIKVAICDQLETPSENKKLVHRQVTELITPGTFINSSDNLKINTYLMCVTRHKNTYAYILIDPSTGTLILSQLLYDKDFLTSALEKYKPNEIIFKACDFDEKTIPLFEGYYLTPLESSYFDPTHNTLFLKKHFQVETLSFFELNDPLVINACGAALLYLKQNLKKDIRHIKNLSFTREDKNLYLPQSTIKHLEILEPSVQSDINSSLYYHLNHTQTSLGARFLKYSLINPSIEIDKIKERHSIVSSFKKDQELLANTRKILSKIPDLERLFTKIALKTATPQDTWSFYKGLEQSQLLRELVDLHLKEVSFTAHLALTPVLKLIKESLEPDPPSSFGESRVFLKEFSSELEEIRQKALNSYSRLLEIEKEEQQKTNLLKLKLKYNKVIGYYFEISKGGALKIPPYFIRKQSLVNVERFTIDKLINFENEVLEAKARLLEQEQRLFTELCEKIVSFIQIIENNNTFIKNIDLLTCFAYKATQDRYTCPEMIKEGSLKIEEARHPVIEKFVEHFIWNSLEMDDENNRVFIISGPNMAGKSTFLRQVALITLLAHIGSFVPAKTAQIPITDKIFTRIGASDNLAKGESTFLVEMSETAQILRGATKQSLIIMDEIGRGTSTNDGLSIAWAIVEFFSKENESKGKVLFATHYHELTSMATYNSRIKNYKVAISEYNGKVIFLHKVELGIADKSYGIHVAQLAGLPLEVTERANIILGNLEKSSKQNSIFLPLNAPPSQVKKIETDAPFSSTQKKEAPTQTLANELFKRIQKLNINSMTPLEALNILMLLKKETFKKDNLEKENAQNLFE
jgi:DNA mismatch repair protein MutS